MACSIDAGNGEAALLFAAAERLDQIENRLRQVQAVALYLRSTCADIARLLEGQQVSPFEVSQDLHDLAKAKAIAVCRATAAAKLD